MTVQELRAVLATCPDDLPVVGHWDTISGFDVRRVARFTDAVVLDVDSWSSSDEQFLAHCREHHDGDGVLVK